MKVLVICQYYYPEPFRINDFCEELVRRGHEVKVITGVPNYAEGIIYKGYEDGQIKQENINGVIVQRCRIIPRGKGSIQRILNYFSFPLSASLFVRFRGCKASDDCPYDVVLVNQLSPVMMAKPAIVYKKKYKKPIILYCLDLWPESLVAGGIGRNSVIYKAFHWISKRIYKSVDQIIVTSDKFQAYFEKEFGIQRETLKYVPQYAESMFEKLPYKQPGETIDLVFAGNIGAAQNVDTIIRAAEILSNNSVHFHIVGGGSELDNLKKMVQEKELRNVFFYGRRPLNEMNDFYKIADAMLITLQPDAVLSLTLPGKIQSYMAAGKPIIGAIDGEAAAVIKKANCGFCGKSGDAKELANNIAKFINSNNKNEMCDNARGYYERYFSREVFFNKMEDALVKICD